MIPVDVLQKYLEEREVTTLRADGFDDAIIGIEESTNRLIYSVSKCIEILRFRQGMEELDAIDHFWYNVAGSYVGELTPIWCNEF